MIKSIPYCDGWHAAEHNKPRKCPDNYQGEDQLSWYEGYDAMKAIEEQLAPEVAKR